MTDYLKAMADPVKVFTLPNEDVKCKDLSLQQKIDILKQWEYDAREMEVAEEENMGCDTPDLLYDVLMALRKLKVKARKVIFSAICSSTTEGKIIKPYFISNGLISARISSSVEYLYF